MERLAQKAAVDAVSWLKARASRDLWTGFDVAGWDDTVWILHAMYESDVTPADDAIRLAIERGLTASAPIGNLNLDGAPGEGWRRLRWQELAERLGHDPWRLDLPPCFRSFPYQTWPATIDPPQEGSMDRAQFERLVADLAGTGDEGPLGTCTAYYAPLTGRGDPESPRVFRGALTELVELYDNEDLSGSPSNIWPDDRSWLVWTDWDLWGTRVSGEAALIERLAADEQLETVSLPY